MNAKMMMAGALLCMAVAPVSADNYSLWPNYNVVTINTSGTGGGANVASTLTGYPVLVRLTSGNFTAFATAGTKASLRFARGATHLPYEVERWDSTGGNAAEIWVLVDSVFGSTAAQTITMYWGEPGAADSSNTGAVFTAANGYVGVWHLGNAPGINPRPNSVAGKPPATPSNDAGTFGVANYTAPLGVIGYADTIRGSGTTGTLAAPASTDDYLYIGTGGVSTTSPFNGNNTDTSYNNFSNGYTLSMWFKPAATKINVFNYLSELSNTTQADANIQFFRPSGSTFTSLQFTNSVANGGGSLGQITTTTNAFVANTWVHLVTTIGAGSTPAMAVYLNGVSIKTGTGTGAIVNTLRTNVWFGKSNYTGDGYNSGSFDEPEISNVVRSADWIKMNYQSQFTGQTCVTLGPTVTPPPSNLTYNPNPAIYTVGYAIPNNVPTVTGVVTGYAVSPGLPTGLSINATTGVISGTPTAATPLAAYVVTATNSSGSTIDTVRITVNAALVAPSGLSYSTNPAVYGTNTAITANTPTVTGTVTGYTVSPALPAGLSLNATTGVITGTPTVVAAATNYLVTASNSAGGTTAFVNITVIAPPSGLSYSTPTANYPANAAIANNTPTVTGTVTGYTVSPALPAGLVLNPTTGVISGTPTAAATAANYIVTASNAAGSTTATVNITVYGPPSGLSYVSSPVAYQVGVPILANNPVVTGTVTKYTVSPALPAGLKLDSVSGSITGTPTAANGGYVTYTVTAANGAGTATFQLQLEVIPSTAIARPVSNSYLIRISGASPVSFLIPDGASQVRLSIVDIQGGIVWSRTVEPAKMNGIRELSWDGVGANGQRLSAGLYIARVNIVGADGISTGTVEKKINLAH